MDWMERRSARGKSIHPFCNKVKRDPLETECTEDRSSVALCNLVRHGNELPAHFQVRMSMDDDASRTGRGMTRSLLLSAGVTSPSTAFARGLSHPVAKGNRFHLHIPALTAGCLNEMRSGGVTNRALEMCARTIEHAP